MTSRTGRPHGQLPAEIGGRKRSDSGGLWCSSADDALGGNDQVFDPGVGALVAINLRQHIGERSKRRAYLLRELVHEFLFCVRLVIGSVMRGWRGRAARR